MALQNRSYPSRVSERATLAYLILFYQGYMGPSAGQFRRRTRQQHRHQ